MSRKTVLITGGNGAIGQALCIGFKQSGWRVISTDQGKVSVVEVDGYIPMDLKRLCSDDAYQEEVIGSLRSKLYGGGLDALVNNAAVQIVAPVEDITIQDFKATLDINVVAPFVLVQSFLSELQKANGSVTNIASIHAQLTKPSFTAYATSKGGLVSLTRSLAIELGSRVRVNAVCPAAIDTPMLKKGFESSRQNFESLKRVHPSGCIGRPQDVVDATLFLSETEGRFLNGVILGLDGGIASRLHEID